MISYENIKNAILNNPSVVFEYLPDGHKEGSEYRCANIFGGEGDSFAINLNTGLWSDFATGESGASLIDLLHKRGSYETYKQAADALAFRLGIDRAFDIPEPKSKAEKAKEKVSIPRKYPFFPPAYVYSDGKERPVSKVWYYNNKNGDCVMLDVRVDFIDKDGKQKKDVYPMLWNGEKWYKGNKARDRALYQLDKLSADTEKTVVVGEGCKTADAIQAFFPNYIATSWQGGCKAVDKTDWSPLYGRNVTLIPDADKQIDPKTGDFYPWEKQPGMVAMEKIANILHENGSVVRIVNTYPMSNVKSGWDIADAEESGMSQSDLIDYIRKNIYDFLPSLKNNEEAVLEPEVVIRKSYEKYEYDDTYFKFLGVDGKTHFYYQKATGQIISLQPNQYKKENLICLAPLSWWEKEFPQKNGANWESAVDWLCRSQEKFGVFDKKMIRGRGAWFDDGKPVLHLGTSLYVNGNVVGIDDFHSNYIYEKAPPLAVKVQTILPKEDASRLVEICRLARWEKPYHGDILAGWIFSAMVCGAMKFRSHLYLIGAAGSGKSWMLENVVKPIMGRMCLAVSSKTTEAGIREALGGDILPVIFDEAEAENNLDRFRIQQIFDLSRQASSENSQAIYKGGSNGTGGISYLCRSSFMFASINNSMTKTADMSRTAVIKLKTAPTKGKYEEKIEDNKRFKELDELVSRILTEEYCRCLLTRALSLIPRLRECATIISNVCAQIYGSKRVGDQMGMILAGLWCLQNDSIIELEDAKDLIKRCAIQDDKEDDGEIADQEERCFNHLLHSDVDYNRNVEPFSRLVAFLAGRINIQYLARENLSDFLACRGVKVIGDYLYIAKNEKSLPSKIFFGTEWEGRGWKDALCRLDGVESEKNKRFDSTLVSQAIKIPLKMVVGC